MKTNQQSNNNQQESNAAATAFNNLSAAQQPKRASLGATIKGFGNAIVNWANKTGSVSNVMGGN